MPDNLDTILSDSDFHKQPLGERLGVLRRNFSEFRQLPLKTQGLLVARAQQKSMGYDNMEKLTPDSTGGQILTNVSNFAQDAVKGMRGAAMQTVYGGGDLIRRAQGEKRIINTPEVKAVTNVPDSAGGKFGSAVGTGLQYGAGNVRTSAGILEKAATSSVQATGIGAGQSADLKSGLTQGAVAAALPLAINGAKTLAPPIRKLAEKVYKMALLRGGGVKEDKIIAGDVAPELIKRGITALTEGGLSRKIQDGLQESGREVERVENDIINRPAWTAKRATGRPPSTIQMTPPGKVDMRTIKADFLIEMRSKFYSGGKVVPGMEGELNSWKKIAEGMSQYGPEPDFRTVIKARRVWDAAVAEAKGFQRPDLAASKEALRAAANSARKELGRAFPELAKANGEYSFYAKVNQIVENTAERKAGHGFGTMGPIGALMSVAAGAASGHGREGAIVGMALGGLDMLLHSTGVRTMEPIMLDKLAGALSKGGYEQALRIMSLVGLNPSQKKSTVAPAHQLIIKHARADGVLAPNPRQ